MSPADIAMVSCEALTNAVVRDVELKFTTAPFTKFVPLTASVNAGPPTTTLDGLREEIIGGGPYTLNVTEVESPPPGLGLATKTATGPATATSPAWMAAVSCVALENVVTRAWPPK